MDENRTPGAGMEPPTLPNMRAGAFSMKDPKGGALICCPWSLFH